MRIAVCLFAFKRPRYLRRAIRTHKKVEGLDYFAFIDYSEIQDKIYEIVDEAGIYTTIFKRPLNLGLNENIKRGIQHVFILLGYDAVIVLEDDLLIAEDGIEYLKYTLENHEDIPGFFSISLVKGLITNKQFMCWGWGIWKDRWEEIDWSCRFDKPNRESWDMVVAAYMRQAGLYCLCSDESRVKHIGWQGVHYSYLDLFPVRRMLRKLF